jgi:hypothetical protein
MKSKIFDRATTALVNCFLLGGVAFGEPDVVLVVVVLLLLRLEHRSGSFIFLVSLFFLVVCIRTTIRVFA